jgi:hypothetical protein
MLLEEKSIHWLRGGMAHSGEVLGTLRGGVASGFAYILYQD